MLDELIKEGEVLADDIIFCPPRSGVIRTFKVYKAKDLKQYQDWISLTQRFIKLNYPEDLNEFVNLTKKISPENHKNMLGILNAIKMLPNSNEALGNNLTNSNTVNTVNNICLRFHLVAKQLERRYNNRETIKIQDEYDVQDLFHALLRIYFDDIRPEEWTPSYAGNSSRMDFLLKEEKIVIEIKKTREKLKAKEIKEQLAIDILNYKAHEDCERLICFVYDPDNYIINPNGIEKDLTFNNGNIDVVTIIVPK